MYFKRLEKCSEERKAYILRNIEEDEKDKLWQILTLPSKEAIKENEQYLTRIWIVNWVWPSRWSERRRRLFNGLFPSVDYFFHDIEFFIGGYEKDRIRADFGIFKYMLLSIAEDFFKLFTLQIIGILKFLFYALYLPFWVLKLVFGFIIWQVMILASNKAFNYYNI